MTRSVGKFPPDPWRKARFREIARTIVAKDRSDRGYGLTVDTAGAIARALERAYRDGVLNGPATWTVVPEQSDIGPVEWALIPPRPRDAFWNICLLILGDGTSQSREGHLAPAITERGTPGWAIIAADFDDDRVIGDRSIVPLVRLGLLERASDLPERLLLTERGQATWLLFCQRGGHYPDDLTTV